MVRLPKWLFAALAVALFLDLAGPVLADETKGKIEKVILDKNQLVVKDDNAQSQTFDLAPDAKVQINDKPGTLADLKAGDQVTVTWERKGAKMVAAEIRCKRA